MGSSHIVRKIMRARPNELLSTRDFLSYGTRGAVDQALHRCVKRGLLVRWARGIFSKDPDSPPTPRQLAETKARAFKKRIVENPQATAHRLQLTDESTSEHIFLTSGRTSRFRFAGGYITLKGTCQKRLYLAQTRAGDAIRALCFLTRSGISAREVERTLQHFSRRDNDEMQAALSWMPSWLSDLIPRAAGEAEKNLFALVRRKAISEWALSVGAA